LRSPIESSFGSSPRASYSGKLARNDWVILGVFVTASVWALGIAGVGWTNSLSDEHGFRQTQTAITSYYLVRGGPFLSYETPVLGAPWSIPFEFPLYQGIVAFASTTMQIPLVAAGRLVSEAFFWLSLIALWPLLAQFEVSPTHRLVFVTLIAVSPLYLFWSRTFLIESTALFFGIAYLLCFVRFAKKRGPLAAAAGTLFGVLGALVKVTTFAGFAAVGTLVYLLLSRGRSASRRGPRPADHWVAGIAFAVLPVIALSLWTVHADSLKALNTVGSRLTSTGTLEFTLGTARRRFETATWNVLFSRIVPDLQGSAGVLALLAVSTILARGRLAAVGASVGGFLFVFLVFTPVQQVHDYYCYANGVFLIGAGCWCILGLLETPGWRRTIGIAIFVACTAIAVAGYYRRFYDAQRTNAREPVDTARVVKGLTLPEDVLLVFGEDWSSEIPFYAERRALMWPQWMPQSIGSQPLREAIAKLGERSIGAVLACQAAKRRSSAAQIASALGLSPIPRHENGLCVIYARARLD
jgi:hypothetical protein